MSDTRGAVTTTLPDNLGSILVRHAVKERKHRRYTLQVRATSNNSNTGGAETTMVSANRGSILVRHAGKERFVFLGSTGVTRYTYALHQTTVTCE
ncbi:hypothetical protein RRG08_032945 [Elysia crispata]|uniref:Uncharacterized protein n=1 Tax=Elysia crispata TaxID=231223 RepID=A0AAE0Z7D6_9GAST|nr:hypothetical protein RRG08_032945 [Elysia crispata]